MVYLSGVQPVPESREEWAVCVYCASGPSHPGLLALAGQLGEAIADRGWTLVSGGGNVSAMGAMAAAARARRGRTVGVIPKALVHREVADVDADELIVTDTMRERKQVMEDRADAFIALPGGVGTLEELFEVLTWAQLGMHAKPVGLLNVAGYYDDLLRFLDHAAAQRFVKPEHRRLLLVGRDGADLLAQFREFEGRSTDKWFDRK